MPALQLGEGLAGETALSRGHGLHQLRPLGPRPLVVFGILGQDRQHHLRAQRPAQPGEAPGPEARRAAPDLAVRALHRGQASEDARDPRVGLRLGQGVVDHGPVGSHSGVGVAAPLSHRHEGPST